MKNNEVHPGFLIHRIISFSIFALFILSFYLGGLFFERTLSLLTRVQFLPSFLNTVLAGGSWFLAAFLPIALLTLLLGRVYCSTICPLGSLQDILILLKGSIRKRVFRYNGRSRIFRFIVLGLTLLGMIIGTSVLINLLEPYSLFSRIIRDFFAPLISLGGQLLMPLLKTFDIFLAPEVTPIHVPVLLLTFIFTVFLVTTSLFWGRFFCAHLCPVGGLLSLLALPAPIRIRVDQEACISCGLCESKCPTRCINAAEKRIDQESCVVCFSCLSGCPTDAIAYERKSNSDALTTKEKRGKGFDRQGFFSRCKKGFRSLTGSVFTISFFPALFPLFWGIKKRTPMKDGNLPKPATPPGSLGRRHFTSYCTACHLCVSKCPTGVLQPSLFEYGPRGMLQPVMDYDLGYCEYECTVCTEICPSGAIQPLPLREKKLTKIGTVTFIKERCIVFSKHQACGACAEVCPTQAVRMVPYEGFLTQPKTDEAICMGCGNCEYVCPVEGGTAIYVDGEEIHSIREERKETAAGPDGKEEPTSREDTLKEDEFPF